jgi:5-dehydro-2-deoxygluconokinase
MTDRALPFDVLTIGRVGIDLYPLQSNVTLDKVESFKKSIGGSPTNVAIAAAKHGLCAAVITRTGMDPFGQFIRDELIRLGVSDEFVSGVKDLNTPVVFAEIFPPDDFPLYYYREPIAPDLMIDPNELDLDAIKQAKIYWSTLTGLSEEPSRRAHYAAWNARDASALTVLDLDYRPTLWDSPAAASAQISKALEKVSIVIGNLQECKLATSESDPDRVAHALIDKGAEIAVVKMGPHGVLAMSHNERVIKLPHHITVLNGLGAGDSFGGALCYGLLEGWDLDRVITFANMAGAINASRSDCSTAMPTTQEVESALMQSD